MGRNSEEGSGLLSVDDGEAYDTALRHKQRWRALGMLKTIGITLSLMFNVVVIVVISHLLSRPTHDKSTDLLYSPARDAVTYKVVTNHNDVNERTIYQEHPSPEVDDAWDELYRHVFVQRISESQAAQLNFHTLRVPTDPNNFVMGLDVFHQLHCLNGIRKLLYPAYYASINETLLEIDHSSHCIEMLRQVLMCHADISPVPWLWDAEMGKPAPLIYNDHQCRDFDKIRDWAHENRLMGGWMGDTGDKGVNPGDSRDLIRSS